MTFYRPKRVRIKKQHEYYRNYDDPSYKEFRSKVLDRDCHKCQWPNCGATKKLQVHHIRKWADNYSLRVDTLNGITICKEHHDLMKGSEEYYQGSLSKIAYENHKKQQEKINARSSSRRSSSLKNVGRKPSEAKTRTKKKPE